MLNCVHVICNICQCPKSALEQCKQINRFKQDDNEWMAYSFKDTAQNEGNKIEKLCHLLRKIDHEVAVMSAGGGGLTWRFPVLPLHAHC